MRVALGMTMGIALGGCLGSGGAYHCASDTDCARTGASGHCEATSYCAFDDSNCPGGRRYDPTAGDLANKCVAEGIDAAPGTSDAALDAASTCPAERVPPCHPNLGTGPGCDPIALTDGGTITLGIALVGDVIHYASGTGDVHRVSIAGVAGAVIDGAGQDDVALAVDATHLYWTDYYTGVVRGAPLAAPSTPFDVTTLASSPYFGKMTVHGDTLYIVGTDAIWRAGTDGSQPTPLKVASRTSSNEVDVNIGIAVDDADVYFTDADKIRRIPLGHLGDDTFVEDFALTTAPGELELDADRVYWTSTSSVSWRNKDGTGLTVIDVNDARSRGLTLDAQHVYWTSPDGRIRRVIKGGTAADIETIAQGPTDPYELTVDCGAAYWGTFTYGHVGTIYKARLP
jgi:hypothetical protein